MRKYDSTRRAPRQPLLDRSSAGGFAFALDDWTRLDRFLILGSAAGTYYASDQTVTDENTQAVMRCVKADGPRTVMRIVAIRASGRSLRNTPAIYALAMAAAGDEPTRTGALGALSRVCRTGNDLLQFAEFVQDFRGWGRGLRRAVADWYLVRPLADLVQEVIKPDSRPAGGRRWSHRDLLRLAHPKPPARDSARAALFARIVGPQSRKWVDAPAKFEAAQRLTRTEDATEAALLIIDYKLPYESVPSRLLDAPEVWEALLHDMPLAMMMRSLGKMSETSVLKPRSTCAKFVVERLSDAARIKRSRVHPLAVLLALNEYENGRGPRGIATGQTLPSVTDALNHAFVAAFANVPPTRERLMLGLDVSPSMAGGGIAGTRLSPRLASAAMAMVTANVESEATFCAFGDRPTRFTISRRQRLPDIVEALNRLPAAGTDGPLPITAVLQNQEPVDAFVVYTDNETWAGDMHPAPALQRYREKTGIPTKLVVVGMTSKGFSIADPNDGGMLDVVGFDAVAPHAITDFIRRRA